MQVFTANFSVERVQEPKYDAGGGICMNINYQKMLDDTINKLGEVKPKLLLHACCAPCSSYVLEYLNNYFDITLYFYNPNIYPYKEFEFRAEELKRLVDEMKLDVKIVVEEYENEKFEEIANPYSDMPEGQVRCFNCYRLRLEKSVKYAKDNGFDFVTTTLSISPHKNAAKLNEIGGELAKKYGVEYLYSDFKKKNGYKRSCELSEQFNLYRQNYCGCVYSKVYNEKKNEEMQNK